VLTSHANTSHANVISLMLFLQCVEITDCIFYTFLQCVENTVYFRHFYSTLFNTFHVGDELFMFHMKWIFV